MNLARWNTVLAVLALVLLVPVWWTWRSDAEAFTPIDRIPLLFEGLAADSITRIELQQGVTAGETDSQGVAVGQLVIGRSRPGDSWVMGPGMLAGALVDGAQVQVRVIEHLLSVRADPDRVVVADPDAAALGEFGLLPEQALKMTAYQGKESVAELWIGNPSGATGSEGNAVRGVFVRAGASGPVRLYEGARVDRNLSPQVWLDRSLFSFSLADVKSLRIRSPLISRDGGIQFAKKQGSDATWVAVNPPEGVGDLKQQEITNLVVGLAALETRGLRAPAAAVDLSAFGLAQPEIEVAIEMMDGGVIILQVSQLFDSPDGGRIRFGLATGRPRVFDLFDTDVRAIRRKPEVWFGPPR